MAFRCSLQRGIAQTMKIYLAPSLVPVDATKSSAIIVLIIMSAMEPTEALTTPLAGHVMQCRIWPRRALVKQAVA